MRIRLTSQLLIAVGALMCIALASSALTLWNANAALAKIERIDYAHRVYESYLTLSGDTYALFKQYGDKLLLGRGVAGDDSDALESRIRSNIDNIRSLVAQEIELYGEEEIEELELLSRIERKLERLLQEYRGLIEDSTMTADGTALADVQSSGGTASVATPTGWMQLSSILDGDVSERFKARIEEALAEETEEVVETLEATRAELRVNQSVAASFGLLALLATLFAFVRLHKNVRTPVQALLGGVGALQAGQLDHRVQVAGPAEFSELGGAFNRMADELAQRERALGQSNTVLEATVAERTAELNRVLDTLREGDAKRRRLMADVSHELRTPLTIIRGEADIALRGKPKSPEFYEEALRRCRESAVHTASLVDDLLFVAREESGEVRLSLEQLDLAEFLPGVVDGCRALAGAGGGRAGELRYVSSVTQANLRADPGRVRQAAIILIDNSLRYGGENIEVRLDRAPGGFAITVIDDGPGMDETERERAFERFFRGTNAAQRYFGGAGLGLPVAKSIVEAHGGQIAIEADREDGMSVSITLPERPNLKAVA